MTSRRSFLGSLASALAVSSLHGRMGALAADSLVPRTSPDSVPTPAGEPVLKPRRLRPGDVVGLVDPASATWEPVDIDIVEESLAVLGLKTKRGRHLLDRRGYLAGRDEDRARDLMDMFADPEVSAVQPVRGGWGSARLLKLLDFDLIRRNPKILLGYSDITALLLSVHARAGLITFHGVNGASEWNLFNAEWFRRVLMEGEAVTFANVKEKGDLLAQVEHRVQTITPGTARGRLLGGNLTVLTTIIGSGLLPAWDDCILFLEDVNEAPYRVDRMFTQLKLAGILDKVRAVVWGTCSECDPGEGYGSLTLTDVLNDHVKTLGVPAWQGAMIGHIDRQFILPVGLEVEIDATAGTIRMLEPAVS